MKKFYSATMIEQSFDGENYQFSWSITVDENEYTLQKTYPGYLTWLEATDLFAEEIFKAANAYKINLDYLGKGLLN